ncbi:MAG: PHB depolymerase family esterase [Nocardioidaceae bacterium]|nr:PHB depolymerase family esterase [Nocardioidaceae bacterium]
MNDDGQANMAEATRLTRAGRLAEATALLQRKLGKGQPPATTPGRAVPADRPALMPAGRGLGRATGERLREKLHRGGDVPAAKPTRTSSPALPGTFTDAHHSGPTDTRRYKLYIPSGYTGSPRPLIVMLHGGTQSADDFAAGTGMNAVAERETFLVAYPEQSTGANAMKYWNWFRPVDQRRGGGEPALIAGITQEVLQTYAVDAGQVFVAGFSAGAAMAAVMAATYPDLYAAAGVHSGLAYGSAQDVGSAFAAMKQGPSRPVRLPGATVPLIVFHGDQDQTVAQVNADRLVDQWRSSPAKTATSAPTVRRDETPGGRAYSQSIYSDAEGDVAMEQWIVHGGGHAWSGGSPAGSYTDPLGPDASVEMARFFQAHRR